MHTFIHAYKYCLQIAFITYKDIDGLRGALHNTVLDFHVYACKMYVCIVFTTTLHVFMCVCMYVCMYLCVYVCMYACMYVCTYVCMYACNVTLSSTHIHFCVCAHKNSRILYLLYTYIYTYIYIHTYIYIICIYIHTQILRSNQNLAITFVTCFCVSECE
jgi:hypothetical protein